MEMSNVRFATINIDNLSFGYVVGETSKEGISNNAHIIQPFDNFNYLISETHKRNSDAIFQLGMCFEFGAYFFGEENSNQIISFPIDIQTAIELFKLSGDNGNSDANHHLGMMCEHGKNGKVDRDLASSYFKKSANAGNADSNYILGIYELQNDRALAYNYFLKAADLGNANAQFNVAVALYEGNTVWEKNLAMAFGYAKAAYDSNPKDLELEKFMNKVYLELMNSI
jgi:TPR repeat protein